MNWDLTFKAIAVITTTLVGLHQWRSLRFRSKLKNDLEILKLYKEVVEDPNYSQLPNCSKLLKEHIDETIRKGYEDKGQLNSRALFVFILTIVSIGLWLKIFINSGLTPTLLFLFLISSALAIILFPRLREK